MEDKTINVALLFFKLLFFPKLTDIKNKLVFNTAMPGPATIISLGAVGAAAIYAKRRNSQTSETDSISPIALARRRSSTVQADPEWQSWKQPEILWRRNNGVSFSHNSMPQYPTGIQSSQKDLQHTSTTK
jgi:hypothetical protein